MRSYNKYLILTIALVLVFSISSVCAGDFENTNLNHINNDNVSLDLSDNVDDVIEETSQEITVNDWDDLQYYCSLNDKDYVLKLKENTNYYPSNLKDESYQIQVNNNVTIIGSSGAYIGDSSPNARTIAYLAIDVPENSGNGITLKGVTFKWISSEFQPNAIFLRMAGNANNVIEDCIFTNISITGGHSSVVQIMRGDVTLTNCSFTDITSDFGCLSIYDPKDDPTDICTHARAEVDNCYFEGNYARTEPGCINNCGVLVVRNSTFYRNSAFWWAGAIHTHGGANTTIYDSNFTDNVAGWNGGALYTYSYLQIYNTIFKGNNCTTNNGGGAIGASKYLHSPCIHIENSLFEDNENLCWGLSELSTTGTGRGGAISIMDEGALTVLNTTFIKNSASIGTAICAISQGTYGSPDVTIVGNRFINHTRVGDVLVIKLNYDSKCEISDNYYSANSIEFSKLKLTADERVGDEVTLHIDAALKNSKFYDSDILDKTGYDVYMDGQYLKTVNTKDFTLNLKNIEKAQVYVVPSISVSKSNEVSVGLPKEYIYVSQKSGNDNNDGSKNAPVKSIAKAVELAERTGNIIITDGTFSETNINVNYNLTITGESNVVFTSKGNIFTLGDVEVSIKNLTFKKCKQASSSSERIIKHGNGILIIDNCNFEDNSYYMVIETTGAIEADNLYFKGNSAILIQANNYNIKSSEFDSNTADSTKINALIRGTDAKKCSVSDSTFSNNKIKQGCLYFTTNGDSQNTLTVSNSVFSNNAANDGSSGIYMDKGMLIADSILFFNNTDSGSYSAVIFTATEVHVTNSIFLANTMSNSNNVLINAKSATNLKKIYCDGNWFGNTQDNYDVAPQISPSSNCNNWLFLNASANSTSLRIGENASVSFNLNNMYNRDGNVTYWDAGNLPTVELSISTAGGKSSEKQVALVYGMANTIYTLQNSEGNLIATYYSVVDVINFTEARAKVDMTVNADNILVGDDEVITITLPNNATGNLTVTIGNITQNKEVINPITIFTIVNLEAGNHTAVVTYSGDDYYALTKQSVEFSVGKYNSTTELSVGEIEVGYDVILTVNVSPSVTGNITLIINNKEEIITLQDSKVTYKIKSISRGDYSVKAIYNGNYKYASSEDSLQFSVDKLNTTIDVDVSDIVYGHDATVNVTLNDTATGNVTVSVNGENTTSKVENGKAIVTVSNLNAGHKEVIVYYSGDNTFNANSYETSFDVAKANATLTVSAADVMVGQDVNIEVTVGRGVNGNVTITCNNQTVIKTIPRTGKVSLKISDLSVGEYKVSATLISDNYVKVENTTEFKVSDYQTPQWPNEGYDTQNTGKSPYETDSNGAIIWSYNIGGNVTGNLAIDCNGNIFALTSKGLISFNENGQLWIYAASDLSGIAVSRDVVIVPEAGNTIHFINQNTGEKFGNSNIYQGSSLFAPVVDSNANVYISSEYQFASDDYKLVIIPYKLWKNGGNPILISLGNSRLVSAPVVTDNIAVVACSDALNIIDLDKKQVISTIKGTNDGVRPVIGPGNMIYAILGDSIVEITPQGNQIWKTKVSGGVGNSLALDGENGLYALNSQGNLYRYDLADGSESLVSNLTFTSGILIGNDGNVYVGSEDMLYAFDSENNLLWKSYVGNEIIGSPVVDENGAIYVATSDRIYALSYAKLNPHNFTAKADNISVGEVANVIVTLPKDATGKVSCLIGDKYYYGDVKDGIAVVEIPDLVGGNHIVNVTYLGDYKYEPISTTLKINVEMSNATIQIITKDVYYSGDFIAVLSDLNGHPIVDEKLFVDINGTNHELTTNTNGRIYLNLRLNPDYYEVFVNFKGSSDYSGCNLTSQINVLSTIQANDMTRGYNSGVDYTATFASKDGSSLSNAKVMFIVNGVEYDSVTDNNGVAVLNKKLAVGTYAVVIINPLTGENVTRQVKIVARVVENNNLVMDYLDGSYFKVRIVADDGSYAGAGQRVTFNVGKSTYYANTNANGYAAIRITEVPKTYAVKTTYKGYVASNKIVVKQVLKAKNISKKKSSYYKFSAYLKTSKGKAIAGKKILFKIKGKKYVGTTNKKGIATATIKLNLKPGKYLITSTYSKTTIKNWLIIKK